jgi:large subunit ribosomal protein L9
MLVILKEDIEHLGKIGDTVDVARGYARNYLIPRRLVIEANKKNIKKLEHEKKIITEKAAIIFKQAEAIAELLEQTTLTFHVLAGEEDKLFGSITTKDVAEALKEKGFDIERRKISFEDHIKRLGTYEASIKLRPELSAKVKVHVVRKEEYESS